MHPSPKITIIGAGPSGLTLAVLLHKSSIPFTIYDLHAPPTPSSPSSSPPVSGMLDLHASSGLAALQACDLYSSFLPLTTECSQSMLVYDHLGTLVHSDEGDLGEFRPEISRHALTGLLLSALPSDTVRWGHKLSSAVRQEDGSVLLDFGDKGRVEADLVVGADGAWSKVRRETIPDAQRPRYTGVQVLAVTITKLSSRYPHLAALVGDGGMFALGSGNLVSGHRGAQDSVRLYVGVGTEDEVFAVSRGLASKTAAEVGEVYLADEKVFGRWGDGLKDLIRTACKEETARNPTGKADIRPVYELPAGHTWNHCPGVTLIGDAAHLMTPWAGEGANIAMWDALDLAAAIDGAWREFQDGDRPWTEVVEPKLQTFEVMMAERAASRAEESSRNGKLFLQENAAKNLADLFKSFGPPPE